MRYLVLFEVTKFGLSATDNAYRWSKLEQTIKSILSNFLILKMGKWRLLGIPGLAQEYMDQ